MENIFLLGGHDLEMLTIREMLTREKYTFFDRHLSWSNAFIDEYAAEFASFGDDANIRLYAIELKYKDMHPLENLSIIDHHDDLSHCPSALEQVAAVLGKELDRYQQLVAANDRGYIPEMLRLGATTEEVDRIREADRKAQGVTEEEEQAALEDIDGRRRYGSLTVVKTRAERFSPICDRLYPYGRLLVYNERELTYYGEGAEAVAWQMTERLGKEAVYRGGGRDGFAGIKRDLLSPTEIENIIDLVIKTQNDTTL